MCIEIPAPKADPRFPDAFIWVTNDGTEKEPSFTVGFYKDPDEQDTYTYRICPDLGSAAEVIVGFQMGAITT